MSQRWWLRSIVAMVVGIVGGCYSGEQASLPDAQTPPADEEEQTPSSRCDDNYELVDLEHYCPADACGERPFAVLICGGQHCGHQQPLDLLASMVNCADSASDADLRVGLFVSADRDERGVLVREEPLGSIPARGQRLVRFQIPFEETISLLTEEPDWVRNWSYRLLPEQDEGPCAWLYEPAAVLGDCLGR